MRIPIKFETEETRVRRQFTLSRNWWAVGLRGVIALAIGILALAMPEVTLIALLILVAAYLLADGAFAIIAAVRASRRGERPWPFIVEGAIDIIAGAVIVIWPDLSLIALVYLLAVWAIFSGVVMLLGSIGFQAAPRWIMLIAGALSVLLGVVMIAQPTLGVIALAAWFAAYLILFGALLIAFALWLRQHRVIAQEWASPHAAGV